jgi:hypothetical protein
MGGLVTVDLDATLVTAFSEKEQAAPTWKKTFGVPSADCSRSERRLRAHSSGLLAAMSDGDSRSSVRRSCNERGWIGRILLIIGALPRFKSAVTFVRRESIAARLARAVGEERLGFQG